MTSDTEGTDPTSETTTSTSDTEPTTSDTETTTTDSETTESDPTDDPTTDTVGPECGNGVAEGDEECDDGNDDNTDACLDICILASCGDGFVGPGEACDDANGDNTDTCLDTCTAASCGDGFVGPGEGCDDGNNNDDDTCTNSCALASCGDGVVQMGEQCDDGNDDNTDMCLDTCVVAACGDSFIEVGVEECDDGNVDNTDTCLDNCALATCGDTYVQAGVEECDDGNLDNTDMCTESCLFPSCGDSFLQPDNNEECDDGNGLDGDGCEGTCLFTPGAKEFATGTNHTCALIYAGDLRCWGNNDFGQLGQANTTIIGDNEFPNSVPPIPLGGPVKHIASGSYHVCALMNDDGVRCWGYNSYGELGYGHTDYLGDNEAVLDAGLVDIPGTVAKLTGGGTHTCALLEGGAVRCWGRNHVGQLGYGNTTSIGDDELPSAVGEVDLGGNAQQLCAGNTHTCALLEGGGVRCWGDGASGRLGYGNTNSIGDNELPSSVGLVPIGENVTAISCGQGHTCAVTESQNVRCWGSPFWGQLGYGNMTTIGDNETPASAGDVPVGGPVFAIDLGATHTCALLQNNVRCWGQGSYGQLGLASIDHVGDNELPNSVSTIDVGGPVTSISAGGYHTCAVLEGGAIRCWGDANFGQLGYGNTVRIGDNEFPSSAGDVPFEP